MTTDLARPASPEDRDNIVALGFVARYSDPTRSSYKLNLKQWFAWCHERGIRPLEAQRAHIEVYAREIEEGRGLKKSTVANKLNTIAGFYRFAKIDRYIVDNPAEYLRRPTVPRQSTTEALTRSELLQLLDMAQASDPQEHALLCVLGLNGLRIGEVCALDVEDLGRVGGYRTIRVRREKGNRTGEIPMSPRTSWAIDTHLGTRSTGALFHIRHGVRMDRRGAARIITRLVRKAAIQKRITPHSFRHTFITLSLDAGASIRDVQNSMGYADARPVSYYDRHKIDLSRNATHIMSAYVEGS